MKNPVCLVLALAAVSQTLTSCCSVPPILCCPCADTSYRPFGRPGTAGEAYSKGYVCGLRDQRNEKSNCWDRHREEVPAMLAEYGARGYADGYAGRVQMESEIPDQRRATKLYR